MEDVGYPTKSTNARPVASGLSRPSSRSPRVSVSRVRFETGGVTIELPDLVASLKSVSGCLGVETARTSNGKEVIFAWFADKQAVLRWYNSRVHRATMKAAFPDYVPQGPLKHVPEDVGAVMVIASLSETTSKPDEGVNLPISQIAIELYAPLAGGLHLGGRFARKDSGWNTSVTTRPAEA